MQKSSLNNNSKIINAKIKYLVFYTVFSFNMRVETSRELHGYLVNNPFTKAFLHVYFIKYPCRFPFFN